MNRLYCVTTVGAIAFLTALAAGCPDAPPEEVVVYTALDLEFSEPILAEFTTNSGIAVWPKFDTESTKSVGLAQAIMAESDRPRCDVFWNNEILNTLRLEKKGLIEAYRSPAGEAFPVEFRSARGTWHGFAARARVLIVNNDLVKPEDRPKSIADLALPRWKGKTGIAKPLFGTTATHAACLFAAWGDEKARAFFQDLKRNEVQIMSGNKQVAVAAATGQIAFGLTDTDDALIELEKGHPVTIVYPDREPDEWGTLFIPNTVAVIKGCPHPEEARKLVDFLLSADVERRLALSASAQIPLNPAVDAPIRVETPKTVKAMLVDFDKAADLWDQAAFFLRDQFTVD
jgi:iron(III) transport system substrate-binding protein